MCETQSILYCCYFSKFWDTLKVFLITLKFEQKVMPSIDVEGNANSFKPGQSVSLCAV